MRDGRVVVVEVKVGGATVVMKKSIITYLVKVDLG